VPQKVLHSNTYVQPDPEWNQNNKLVYQPLIQVAWMSQHQKCTIHIWLTTTLLSLQLH